MKHLRAILTELTRRRVLRVMWVYLAGFVVFAATIYSLKDALGISDVWLRWGFWAGLALIPLLAIIAWRYDMVPPQLVRDARDVALENPALGWAAMRHDAKDAGFVLLAWQTDDASKSERRFFQPVSIGRETGNDVELPDPRVSRHHAVLWAEAGAWRVRDLDSANGTFIDAARVAGQAILPQSCELRFHPNGPIVAVCVTRSPETLVG